MATIASAQRGREAKPAKAVPASKADAVAFIDQLCGRLASPDALHAWVRRVGRAAEMRVTLMDSSGRVLADSRVAPERIPAIVAQATAGEQTDYAALVHALDDDDPAVRLYASRALAEATGETFDYRYYHDTAARRPAVERWQRWLDERQTAAAEVTPAGDASP